MKQIMTVALAFVGLLVGAGFATGKEMMQYFISLGSVGLWGVAVTAIMMVVFGAVVLQVGCYFLADEHGHVFKNVAHPRVSWILDLSVSLTMATMGVVMLAGAGSTLKQAFGLPAWIGSLGLAIIVYFVCFLDADHVSKVIGVVTPLMIVAVIITFVWTLFHIPENFSIEAANEIAIKEPSPVSPWWWSAINCAGMTLMCAVGMSLVIGGTHSKLRNVALGGVIGGVILGVMMALVSITLFINIEAAAGMDVPMAAVVNAINPICGTILTIIILIMIFNTALGDFYAFSRRIDVALPTHPKLNLAVILGIGFVISLFGFGPIIQIVFPILGYIGMVIGVMFVAWRIRWSHLIKGEKERRNRIRALTRVYIHPNMHANTTLEIRRELRKSAADDEKLFQQVAEEEKENLDLTASFEPEPTVAAQARSYGS